MEHDYPVHDYQVSRTTEVVKGKGKDPPPVQPVPQLVLLPPSRHTTIHGIDLEEEERLYAELMKDYTEDGQVSRTRNLSFSYSEKMACFIQVVKHLTGAIPRRRTLSTPPEPSKSTSRELNQRMDTFPRPRSPRITAQAYAQFTPIRPRPPRAESIYSSEIYLVDNTTGGSHSAWTSAPPLFAQAVKIDGWAIVGDGANPRQDVMHVPQVHPRSSNTQPSSPIKSTLAKSQVGSLKKVSSGSGAYVVYDIAITTREGTTMKLLRRYSSFEELWEGLMTTLAVSLLIVISILLINKQFRHTFILIFQTYPPRHLLPGFVPLSLKKDASSWSFG